MDRNELVSLYSDLHKDLYGFRPRGEWLGTCPLEQLQAEVDRVAEALRLEIERERQEAEEHRAMTSSNGCNDEGEYPTSGEGWALVTE
jgi:hypothetical protein